MNPTYSRYSPEAWLMACELSQRRADRRRRKFRRYQIGLSLVCAWLAIAAAVLVWWLA